MSDFEVIEDQAEAIKVKMTPKQVRGPEERFVKAVELMNAGQVLFVPGATVNTVSQYRFWMTKRHHRRLMTRTTERNGVKGLYMWAGPER